VPGGGASGIATVLVARERSPASGSLSVCSYLVDTWCLGVKDAFGPRRVSHRKLAEVMDLCFSGFDGDPLAAPIDLARHLVWGAVDYARGLGFERAEQADQVAAAAFERGLLIETSGPESEVAKLMPPLTINEGELDKGLQIVADSVRSVCT
jgi:hypothetical protein